MFVVVVSPNKNGKIEMTKEELQKMLDDAYNKGYTEGKSYGYQTITVPSWKMNDWYTTTTTTLSGTDSNATIT